MRWRCPWGGASPRPSAATANGFGAGLLPGDSPDVGAVGVRDAGQHRSIWMPRSARRQLDLGASRGVDREQTLRKARMHFEAEAVTSDALSMIVATHLRRRRWLPRCLHRLHP